MANGDVETPTQAGLTPRTRPPGDAQRALAKTALGVSFATMGSALGESFGPQAAESVSGISDTIMEAMQNRWHKMEYENFQAEVLEPWQTNMAKLNDEVRTRLNEIDQGVFTTSTGEIIQVDPESPKAIRMRNIIHRDSIQAVQQATNSLMDSFVKKYPTNPMVGQVVNNVVGAQSNVVTEFFGGGPQLEAEKTIADIDLSRAQAERARRPDTKTEGGKEDLYDKLRTMSPEDALSWLLASDDGQALIGGYYSQAADAQIRNEILAEKPGEYTDPATGGIVNPEDLQAEIQARSDEAMRRAAGMLMTDILPPHVVERLRKTKPAFFPAETKAEEPAIVGRVTDAEAKESIKNMQAVSANALSQLVRHRDFSSPNEAIRFLMSNWFNRYLDEHVAKNTQTRQFRDRARRQVMDYLLNNWHQIEIMNDVFREEAKRKTAKKGRGKGDRGPLRGQIREAVERGLITP